LIIPLFAFAKNAKKEYALLFSFAPKNCKNQKLMIFGLSTILNFGLKTDPNKFLSVDSPNFFASFFSVFF